MMNKWMMMCFASTVLAAGVAFAHPPEADDKSDAEQTAEITAPADAAPAEAVEAVEVDCDTLTDDAEKAQCIEEAERRAAAEAKAEEAPRKGGKAQRSNSNRMEADNTDE